jgi:ubiquinone biosynthesis monooxygenase Coq7
LQRFEQIINLYRGSFLLPLWIIAGFLTGFLPALFGKNAVFKTIEAVETFVDQHYQQQITLFDSYPQYRQIKQMLEECRLDEVEHRNEAKSLASSRNGLLIRLWCLIVSKGSAGAVVLAKKI